MKTKVYKFGPQASPTELEALAVRYRRNDGNVYTTDSSLEMANLAQELADQTRAGNYAFNPRGIVIK